MMKVIRSIQGMQRHVDGLRRQSRAIGFVPTMGALHEGHLSLMRTARRQCDAVVVSIFVNPTQFGPHEDHNRYPRDLKRDIQKCKAVGLDVAFVPTARQMYPPEYGTRVSVKETGEILEGTSRPGHFTGVATIVLKLFHIIKPHRAYFGLKDYQQAVIIRRMVKDLNMDTQIVVCPTVREADGLAMSSRNRYLSGTERRAAPVLWKALQAGRVAIRKGVREASKIRSVMIHRIRREPQAKIDYVAVVDPATLKEIRNIHGPTLLTLAVRIGRTRLLDNITVRPFRVNPADKEDT